MAWDTEEKEFVPLIKADGCFENPIRGVTFKFLNLQEAKESDSHNDLIDELKKLFGEE